MTALVDNRASAGLARCVIKKVFSFSGGASGPRIFFLARRKPRVRGWWGVSTCGMGKTESRPWGRANAGLGPLARDPRPEAPRAPTWGGWSPCAQSAKKSAQVSVLGCIFGCCLAGGGLELREMHNITRIALFHSLIVVGLRKHPCACWLRGESPKGSHVAGSADVPEDEWLSSVVVNRTRLILPWG